MKSLQEAARKAGVNKPIGVYALASKFSLSRPISLKILIQKLEAPPSSPSPPPMSSSPVIYVQSNGDGSFIVTGSNFLPNVTVHIRVVDNALTNLFFNAQSTSQGMLNFPTGKLCQLPGNLHFSANDGRPNRNDLTGTLWSNTATVSCPA